jgi:hypothetical protein
MAGNRIVWNETLVKAMECRYNIDCAAGKSTHFAWATARNILLAERKDIYRVNFSLPPSLTSKQSY